MKNPLIRRLGSTQKAVLSRMLHQFILTSTINSETSVSIYELHPPDGSDPYDLDKAFFNSLTSPDSPRLGLFETAVNFHEGSIVVTTYRLTAEARSLLLRNYPHWEKGPSDLELN